MNQTPHRKALSPWWFLLPLMLILTASYAFSLVTIDTGRDWARAWQVASGQALPLQGPLLKSAVHFGPIWFYLLGFFLFLGKSITLATLLLGALAALKFWLAYILGRELLDRNYGLLWALALALPSWNFMGQITFTHFNFVEPATLWLLYTLVRYVKTDEGIWLAASMFAFSLALHAHPSTLPLGFLVLFVWLFHWHRSGSLGLPWLTLGILLFLLPFAPYLYLQFREGWPDLVTLIQVAGKEVGNTQSWRGSQLFLGLLLWPERIIAHHLLPAIPGVTLPWQALVYLLMATGVMGLPLASIQRQQRKLLFGLLGSLLLVLASVVILRRETPYYMVFVCLPFVAGLWALGAWSLLNRTGSWRNRLITALGLATLLVFSITALSIARINVKGEGSFPGKLLADIKSRQIKPQSGSRGMRFASFYQDRLGSELCTAMEPGIPLHLHGTLALIVDTSYGIAMRLHCEEFMHRLLLAGKGKVPDRHLVGELLRLWREIGLQPDRIIGSLGIGRPHRVLHPSQGHGLPPLDKFPPHPLKPGKPTSLEWRFTTDCREYLVISNPLGWYMRYRIDQAKVDGKPVQPLVKTRFATAWQNPDCEPARGSQWHFRLRSSAPQWLDVYTLASPHPKNLP